jgi:hypothetical protein
MIVPCMWGMLHLGDHHEDWLSQAPLFLGLLMWINDDLRVLLIGHISTRQACIFLLHILLGLLHPCLSWMFGADVSLNTVMLVYE